MTGALDDHLPAAPHGADPGSNPVPPRRRGLLIVGHGTRDQDGAADFRAFADLVAARAAASPDLGSLEVSGGFIELSAPPLRDAVADLTARGVRDVVAVPLILLAAGHAKGDIPAALARERERHPGLRTKYGRPIGVHPVVLDLLRARLAAVATRSGSGSDSSSGPDSSSSSGSSSGPDSILLVGRGTTDPAANAELYRAARLLWETLQAEPVGGAPISQVEAAFVSLAEPSVEHGLERLARLGARRVAVLPYFLFRGVLPTRIREQAARGARRHGLAVSVADVLGGADALADLVLERFAEAAGGPVGVNCDACVYRIALPGFGHRVGQPQHPHDHPDDPTHSHGHAHSGHHAGSAV